MTRWLEKRNRRPFFEVMEERARRTELVAGLLAAGGLQPAQAARVLEAEVASLEAAAETEQLEPLAATARSIRQVVALLRGRADDDVATRDVLILEDDEVTQDLIALAVEAQGHRTRVASTLEEFTRMFRERRPDVILTEGQMPGAPVDQFCHFLRSTLSTESVPIVMFASASGQELATLALNAGADRFVSKDQGIDQLIAELTALFDDILW